MSIFKAQTCTLYYGKRCYKNLFGFVVIGGERTRNVEGMGRGGGGSGTS